MNYHFNQLAGALGMLKQHGEQLDWASLDATMRRVAAEHGPAHCDTEEIKAMHRTYRDLCLSHGLINRGELFDDRDAVPLI